MRRRGVRAAVLAVVLAGSAVAMPAAPAEPPERRGGDFVLSPEGNHLWAYDVTSGERQLLVRGENAADPGVEPPPDSERRDINGQICVSPDGRHFVSGEDTVIGATDGEDGAGSHDPAVAGWGYFEIEGSTLGQIRARQVGKLAPESGPGPGYAGDPDNYGCAFLDDRRLFTTGIGDPMPDQAANGQLFLWFGPFDAGFAPASTQGGETFFTGEVPHCELDRTLATAGGLALHDGDLYVATNRPDGAGNAGAVWRFSGRFPSNHAECTEDFLAANVTKELVVPGVPVPLVNPLSPTPSAVAISRSGTLYVSSVFTGKVSEYTTDGTFVRDVYPFAPVGASSGAATGDTPFGLAVTSDGSLWIADIGIVGPGPGSGTGSVIRVRFDDDGSPQPFGETIAEGLSFPDGLGVYRAPDRSPKAGARGSEWACDGWAMFGRTASRQFSTECPSSITPHTVAALTPAWTFRVPFDAADQSTFTASPAIVDGVVYIGGWNGTMYALDAGDGSVVWQTSTADAPGALYGPIVSSAAIAEVRMRGGRLRRLVVFGAGPRLYALDAADGAVVWVLDVGRGLEPTPTQIESSPLIHDGIVFVGRDVHNQPGDRTAGVRGGIMAVDARDGKLRWFHSPEERLGLPASGCGGVWGSPTLDVETGRLYFGTANCPAVRDDPRLPMEEVTALDADTGEWIWTFRPHQPEGQDTYEDRDEDFGATPNLYVDATGRKVVGVGNKDGTYYALDAATGELIWSRKVAEPVPNVGGFLATPAVWGGGIFGGTALGTAPFLHSLDATTGEVRWQSLTAGPTYGPTTVANGVVFTGGLDFTFKALDAADGRLLWSVPAPGAISSGAAVVGDLVVVGSGTSTSDACFKDNVTDDACEVAFGAALGQQGAVHAFRLGPQLRLPG